MKPEIKQFRESLTPLQRGAIRERAIELVDKLLSQGLTSQEGTELAKASAQLAAHEARLGQKDVPSQVGEFRDVFTGKVISATYEGPGNIGLKYTNDDSSKIKIVTVDDLEQMRKMGVLVATNPMRKSGPIQDK